MDHSKLEAFIIEIENAAYARGVADTLAKITAAVAMAEAAELASGVGSASDIGASLDPGAARVGPPQKPDPRPGSDQLTVLNDIRAHPGSRGIEIVKRLDGKIRERTVRTALHRLRVRGAIVRNEDKWFPAAVVVSLDNQGGQTLTTPDPLFGGMAERPNAADSKSVGGS